MMPVTAFISAVTVKVGVMAPVIVAAPNGDIRHWRSDDDGATATGSHVSDTTGKDNQESYAHDDGQKTGIPTPTPCLHVAT
jgi:hypothetical protein